MARWIDFLIVGASLLIGVLVFLLFRGDATFSEKISYALISAICMFIMLFFMRWTIVWFWDALKK